MPLRNCTHCHKRIEVQSYDKDYVHECQGGDFLKKESVVKTGNFTDDPDGSSGIVPNVRAQGGVNMLQGTRAGIEGERRSPKNVHGKRKSTHRLRQHYEHQEW